MKLSLFIWVNPFEYLDPRSQINLLKGMSLFLSLSSHFLEFTLNLMILNWEERLTF